MKQNLILRLIIVLLILIIACILTRTEVVATEGHVWTEPQPIRCLQKALMDLGYDCGDNAPDGRAGPKTMASWKAWDREFAGLVEEGWK